MKEAKIMPINVIESRLVQLKKEREELIIDKERTFIEDNERGVPINEWEDTFFNTELYKYDFCIEEFEILHKLMKSI